MNTILNVANEIVDEIQEVANDFIDDIQEKSLTNDEITDKVKKVYNLSKMKIDFSKHIIKPDIKLKKIKKNVTVKQLTDTIIESEQNEEFIEKILSAKKNKKKLKIYSPKDFIRKSQKKLNYSTLSVKFNKTNYFKFLGFNPINGFFLFQVAFKESKEKRLNIVLGFNIKLKINEKDFVENELQINFYSDQDAKNYKLILDTDKGIVKKIDFNDL